MAPRTDRVLGEVHPAHLARVRIAAVICPEVVVHVLQEGGILVALAVIEIALHLAELCNLQANTGSSSGDDGMRGLARRTPAAGVMRQQLNCLKRKAAHLRGRRKAAAAAPCCPIARESAR